MVGIDQAENFIPGASETSRSHSKGKPRQNPLLRILILAIYLPVTFAARLVMAVTGFHGEARKLSIAQHTVELSHLPRSFDGCKIAFLTDLHCSAGTPPYFLERVIAETNRLAADLILLGGDYISEGDEYIEHVEKLLSKLDAPLGVYGVLGNHDFYTEPEHVRSALRYARVIELYNTGHWVSRGGDRIRIAGVGDLWEDAQNIHAALGDAGRHDTVILLSHNPDYAVEISDPRVDLVLSGHTHGGQITFPRFGISFSNSRYGRRLLSGFVPFDTFQLYISRGLGTVMIPFRWNCPPEITLLTLVTAAVNQSS